MNCGNSLFIIVISYGSAPDLSADGLRKLLCLFDLIAAHLLTKQRIKITICIISCHFSLM